MNTTAEIINPSNQSRFTRSLKAFRAIRLITLSETMRSTLYGVRSDLANSLSPLTLPSGCHCRIFQPHGCFNFGHTVHDSIRHMGYPDFQRQTDHVRCRLRSHWAILLISGRCNDSSVYGLRDCINEYSMQPSQWSFPAPRVWGNPGTATTSSIWSFDSFRASLLVLFEIVSLEGWIAVQGL